MRLTRWSVLAAVGLGLFAGGCASLRRAAGPAVAEKAAPQAEGPAVQVTNRHWQDVDVFLLIGASRYRLGTVSTSHTERFSIARFAGWDTHSMQIFVDPIGSTDTFTTQPFNLGDGQWADCVIEGTLALSSYMVRNY